MMLKKYVIPAIVLFTLALGLFPSSHADAAQNPVLIMTDVSGSMQDKVAVTLNEGDGEVKKAVALKPLLIDIGQALTPLPCDFGIYRVRYLPGNRDLYEKFLTIDEDGSNIETTINENFVTDFPVFNRRTPLADSLRQLDERELGEMNGAVTLLLISDGMETFYDLEDDMAAAQSPDFSVDNSVKGPITEVRRLKEKYGDNISISTIYLGEPAGESATEGEQMLQQMAAMGNGESYSGKAIIEGRTSAADIANAVCKAEMAPPPVTVAPPMEPMVLENIHFDFDQSTITPIAAQILENHARWLAQHPEITVTIEGHCDERGTDEYNMALGERRAKSTKEFLMRMGIDGSRMETISYGEERPADPRHNEEAWTQNRRAQFVFVIQ